MRQLTFVLLVGAVLTGCSPKVITQTEYVDRTEYRDRYVRDTVYESHTEYIYSKNDTIFQVKTEYLYKERLLHDTIFKEKIDSIPYEVIVTEYVEKDIKDWQRFLMILGAAFIALIIYKLYKLLK